MPPYDLVNDVLNTARARLNDRLETLEAISGKLLDLSQASTQQMTNAAWRKLQDYLADLGFLQLRQEAILTGLATVGSLDPAARARLDWSGYHDGATQHQTPVLPADLMIPLKLWERQTGTMAAFGPHMQLFLDGLPDEPKRPRNLMWEWRADAIYLPGATVSVDLKILYSRYLADFADVTANPGANQVVGAWFEQPVPILRSLDSLADYICREVSVARGDAEGVELFQASAEDNARKILNRDIAMKQRSNIRRRSRSGRLENGF